VFDVLVIGAGASGSFAAEKLARAGQQVLILEKKSNAGIDVCCTGIIGLECLEFTGLNPSFIQHVAHAARFFSPSGQTIRMQRDEPVAFVLDRATLDQALMARALEAGADCQFSARVTRVESLQNGLRVHTTLPSGTATFDTRSLVLATGYGSSLVRQLGMGQIPALMIGAQAEVRVTDVEEIEVYTDRRLAPGGFAWLVPTHQGRGLVGLLTARQHEARLEALLTHLAAQGKIRSAECPRTYGAIPLRPLPKTYGPRVVVVGDAAGQVKPTTGGGLYYGMLCADIAAEVLLEGLEKDDLSEHHLSRYERRWHKRLKHEMALGYLAHRIWRRLSNSDLEVLFELATRHGLSELITSSHQFSFDWHGPMLSQLTGLLPFPFASPVGQRAQRLP